MCLHLELVTLLVRVQSCSPKKPASASPVRPVSRSQNPKLVEKKTHKIAIYLEPRPGNVVKAHNFYFAGLAFILAFGT